MNPELRHWVSIFLRRMPLFLFVSVSIGAAAIAVAVLLPTQFNSRALLLVESPQISDQLARSTVQISAQEQLEIVQQRLLTRSNLLEIAREFRVYENVDTMPADDIVAQMRKDTRFRSSSGRDRATLLEVHFTARRGDIAAEVANEYVTRILSENARQRIRQAEATLAFFEQEVERLETELELQSDRILDFQNANADALPSTEQGRINRQTRLQERLSQINREAELLQRQRERLQEMHERTGGTAVAAEEPRTREERDLAEARRQLSEALVVYSEQSPRVQLLQARIARLEEAAAAAAPMDAPAGADGPASALDLQLAEIDAQLAALGEQRAQVVAELDALEQSLARTPGNAMQLEALQRDYRLIEAQYDAAVQRLSAAETGERIEVMSKGQRISVIEPATAPNEPTSPNRPIIAGGGAAAGMGAALGLMILLELMDKSVRRPVDLTRGLGITPLTTVPYIATRGERLRRRILMLLAAAAVIGGIPAALYLFHYQVMPLDLLFDRIIDRIGL